MVFDARSKAKKYVPVEGDTLDTIAARETQNGNPLTAADIARFNFGTADPKVIDQCLRDWLGAYKRGPDGFYVITDDLKPSQPLLIPTAFKKEGLAAEATITIKVRKQEALAPQHQACLCFDDLNFEFDKSFLRSFGSSNDAAMSEDKKVAGGSKADYVVQLKQLEVLLKAHPQSKMVIFGHTDNCGSDAYNKSLSERRASSWKSRKPPTSVPHWSHWM